MNNTTANTLGSVETPSGKDQAYENFPVGSWLLPPAVRPHVATFYHFARAADDIADGNDLSPDEKLARLDGFEAALLGRTNDPAFGRALRMAESLKQSGVTAQHCLDLLAAFKQDATKTRYASWGELMDYCLLSASPVGRYLLDLHGGSVDGYGPSDALCNALQVINHLQDCQDDYRDIDRVYLPQDWMAAEGTRVADLDRQACTPGLRRVIDRCIGATEELLTEADRLAGGLRSRRLAMESAFIVNIAWGLCERLRAKDPLAGKVNMPKFQYIWCGIRGVGSVLMGRR